jgi:cytochrome c peroxidase
MGLKDHTPILEIVRTEPDYAKAFDSVFGKTGEAITMTEVTQAIAAFERTQVAGNTPFDRWYFGGEQDALTPAQQRGFDVFVNKGRCVSCHVVEQTQALFTDNRFHNVGVGINSIQAEVPPLAKEFLRAQASATEVDVKVLTDKKASELGRFAVTRGLDELGAFKTPTLRNIAVTGPYMHDGSMDTLWDVMDHYNKGGVPNPNLDGGMQRLGLTEPEIDDMVAFLNTLTDDRFAAFAKQETARQRSKKNVRPERDTDVATGKKGNLGDIAPDPTLKNPAEIGVLVVR